MEASEKLNLEARIKTTKRATECDSGRGLEESDGKKDALEASRNDKDACNPWLHPVTH